MIPDGATLASGVTDSITKLIGLAGNVGIGILQLFFIISVSLMITIPVSYTHLTLPTICSV